MIEKITEDYIIIDGLEYIPIDQFGCRGCAFKKYKKICNMVACGLGIRRDGRSVTWKLKDSVSTEITARTMRLLKP